MRSQNNTKVFPSHKKWTPIYYVLFLGSFGIVLLYAVFFPKNQQIVYSEKPLKSRVTLISNASDTEASNKK